MARAELDIRRRRYQPPHVYRAWGASPPRLLVVKICPFPGDILISGVRRQVEMTNDAGLAALVAGRRMSVRRRPAQTLTSNPRLNALHIRCAAAPRNTRGSATARRAPSSILRVVASSSPRQQRPHCVSSNEGASRTWQPARSPTKSIRTFTDACGSRHIFGCLLPARRSVRCRRPRRRHDRVSSIHRFAAARRRDTA